MKILKNCLLNIWNYQLTIEHYRTEEDGYKKYYKEVYETKNGIKDTLVIIEKEILSNLNYIILAVILIEFLFVEDEFIKWLNFFIIALVVIYKWIKGYLERKRINKIFDNMK